MKKVAMEIANQRFDRLLVLRRAGSDEHKKSTWLCVCDCGEQVIVGGSCLVSGNTKSCGCLHAEMAPARLKDWHGFGKDSPVFKHGKTLEYSTYCNMRTRCRNPKARSYPQYGGRGIKICDRWSGENGFDNFLADMGPKPSPKHSIDRVNVNGDYEPSNCKWATSKEQVNNRRIKKIEDFSDDIIKSEFVKRGLSL